MLNKLYRSNFSLEVCVNCMLSNMFILSLRLFSSKSFTGAFHCIYNKRDLFLF